MLPNFRNFVLCVCHTALLENTFLKEDSGFLKLALIDLRKLVYFHFSFLKGFLEEN